MKTINIASEAEIVKENIRGINSLIEHGTRCAGGLRSLKERARWARVNYSYNVFQSFHGDKNNFTYSETRLINRVCLKFGQKALEM